MKCQEFETIVVDLVRGEVTDSTLGTSCWAHAASCSRCADRLLEEEKLTAGLEALATQSDRMQAPYRIEAVLRRTFQKSRARAIIVIAEETLTAPYGFGIARNRMVWAMAAVAVLVVSVVLSRVMLWAPSTGTSVVQNPPDRNASGPNQPDGLQNSKPQENSVPIAASQEHIKPQPAGKVKGNAASHKPAGTGANSKTRRRQAAPTNPLDEMASNFIPLPYGSGLPLDEGWEMVRVSLPRSALETLGVPWAGEEASAELVQADVVLGQDGLARAIRLVQD
jgi:hypothetical protein